MSRTRQYDPSQVTASWRGIDVAEEAESIEVTTDNRRWTRSTGGRGSSVRNKMLNRGGVVRITYPAHEPINTILSGVAKTDDLTENQVGTMTIKDLNGTSLVIGMDAFLEDIPDPTFGQESGTRVWVWQIGVVDKFVGGRETV